VFIILFAIFGLPSLVILVFGQNYHESVVYAQLLVGALAVRNVSSLRFRFIRSKLDANSYRNVLIIGSAAKIVASVTLIPLFGLGGAVTSVFIHRLTISAIVGNAIRTMYLKKC
jgi:O-antigen/teichoic acid export membrane protein